MLSLFGNKQVIDEESVLWLFDAYDWALRNMDAGVFYNYTILVTPSIDHFPDRNSSPQGMAAYIFDKVKEYAGLSHWPCELADAYTPVNEQPQRLLVDGSLRSANAVKPDSDRQSKRLTVPYSAAQLAKPEVIISSFAHVLGHYLNVMSGELPPGGSDYWSHANDFLAVFTGFGIMVANTAYTYKGGCGSCYNPSAERNAYLSQDEASYALAIFCVLKEIPADSVLPHLKKYLRPVFKKSVKDIMSRQDELQKLQKYRSAFLSG